MKRLAILSMLVLVIVAMSVGVASAARYDSGYTTPYTTSPHSGWTVSSVKCNVCHAVHNPGDEGLAIDTTNATRGTRSAASEYLLRTSKAEACVYCHIQSFMAIKTVYEEDEPLYLGTTGSAQTQAKAHDLENGALNWSGCADCHQVHGASTLCVPDAYFGTRKLLKREAGNAAIVYDSDCPTFTVEADTDPMDAGSQGNLTRFCTGCHLYYLDADVGTTGNDTHTMRDPVGSSAQTSSEYCVNCHDAGEVDQLAATNGADNFPHYTGGARFLKIAGDDAAAAIDATATAGGQVPQDGACAKCHIDDGGVWGIGVTK